MILDKGLMPSNMKKETFIAILQLLFSGFINVYMDK